jgi:hypothetical protein
MTYDLESLLDDIETLLKAKLNAKIASIEAEKVLPIGLPAVLTDAYFQQSWSDKILNYSPAIFYGVEKIEATGSGSATLELFRIFVEVVLVDSGMDTYAGRRIHRYSRALKEVFHENFDALPWSTKTNIETVRPVSFALDENTSEEVKVGGVSIVTALA